MTFPAAREFVTRAETVLRAGLEDARVDERSHGAFAVALAWSGDEEALPRLTKGLEASIEKKRPDAGLALAAGLSHAAPARGLLLEALDSTRRWEQRRPVIEALGLLGPPPEDEAERTRTALFAALSDATDRPSLGLLVEALARTDGKAAAERLAHVAEDEGKFPELRVQACAGLGLLGDRESVPSRARLLSHLDYRACTDVFLALWSVF